MDVVSEGRTTASLSRASSRSSRSDGSCSSGVSSSFDAATAICSLRSSLRAVLLWYVAAAFSASCLAPALLLHMFNHKPPAVRTAVTRAHFAALAHSVFAAYSTHGPTGI